MPASRDDDVYQAKLAEQAERYEGKTIRAHVSWSAVTLERRNGRLDEKSGQNGSGIDRRRTKFTFRGL